MIIEQFGLYNPPFHALKSYTYVFYPTKNYVLKLYE